MSKRACSIDGCDSPHRANGYCQTHNYRSQAHGDPDAILASGSYTDRRGTWWGYMRGIDRWVDREVTTDLTPAQMRLKIVREQHRNRCEGLLDCDDHPVPRVYRARPFWIAGDSEGAAGHHTLAEAIAAAHQMTGEKR